VWLIGELQIYRKRRIEIGKSLEGDWDSVVAFSGKALKLGFIHSVLNKLETTVGQQR
jgi:hypothetical protein